MDNAALLQEIQKKFADVSEAPLADPKHVWDAVLRVKTAPGQLMDLARYLRDVLKFNLLNMVTAVDFVKESRFEMVYHFVRVSDPATELFVKLDLPREESPRVASLVPLYASADWQERETHDLYGIRFDGHPDLRRILLWEGYPGWPLRKDYVHTPDRYDNGQELGLPKTAASHGAAS
jgi:NADH/F420H2 dehydrogenase subunit C